MGGDLAHSAEIGLEVRLTLAALGRSRQWSSERVLQMMARRGKRAWHQPRNESLLVAPERTRARRERINAGSICQRSIGASAGRFWCRFYILVHPKEIGRIILVLERKQSRIVLAVGRLNALNSFFAEIIGVNATGRKGSQTRVPSGCVRYPPPDRPKWKWGSNRIAHHG